MKRIIATIVCAVLLTSASYAMAQPSLTLGTAVASGSAVSFPIMLSGAVDGPVSSLYGSIIFNPHIFSVRTSGGESVSATAGPAAIQSGKRLDQSASYNALSFSVLSFGSNTPLMDGQIATITFDIVSSAAKPDEQFRLYNVSASDPVGNQLNLDTLDTTAPPVMQLSISLSGNGSGSVNSIPSGLSCTGGTCSASFYVGSTVSLYATSSAGSDFSGWSGNCNGQACSMTMSANRATDASFSLTRGAKISNAYYGTLGSAEAAAVDRSILQSRDVSFAENLMFDRPVAITLEGGYGADFSSRTGYTTIDGALSIRAGKVTVERIKVK